MTGAPVVLAFPPLIESNFGSFYPSTAVLAAYLERAGIAARQFDLNEPFADFLLSEPVLARMGAGQMADAPWDSVEAAVARWASRNRHVFYDEQGRHVLGTDRFGATTDYSYVMEIIARPLRVDASADVLRSAAITDPGSPLLEYYRSGVLDGVVDEDTRIVGLSVAMGPQLAPALTLAKILKTQHPDVRFVLGGPTLSLMDTDTLGLLLTQQRAVDCVVRFDGEIPLAQLARQAIDGGWQPESVPGVSVLDGTGRVVHVAPGPGPGVDTLPLPDYPVEALQRLAAPALGITQARGCYWGKCDYCDFVELYDGSPPFRGRHADAFVDEVEQLVDRTGITRFRFITESIPPAFASRMADLLIERDLKVQWMSFAMVDRRFDRELLTKLARSGCEFLVIGLETMNDRVLALVHKSATREENMRFLSDAADVGLALHINLIPDLPSTTEEEAMAALEDIAQFQHCFEEVNVFPFEATRSSNIGRSPEQFSLVAGDIPTAPGQAQYLLNQFAGSDPAMDDAARARVWRAYRSFADAHRAAAKERPPLPEYDADTPMRLAVDAMDVLLVDGRYLVTQVRAQARITLPEVATQALGPYLNGSAFTESGLAARLGENTARVLVRKLLESELAVVVPADQSADMAMAGR